MSTFSCSYTWQSSFHIASLLNAFCVISTLTYVINSSPKSSSPPSAQPSAKSPCSPLPAAYSLSSSFTRLQTKPFPTMSPWRSNATSYGIGAPKEDFPVCPVPLLYFSLGRRLRSMFVVWCHIAAYRLPTRLPFKWITNTVWLFCEWQFLILFPLKLLRLTGSKTLITRTSSWLTAWRNESA